MALGIPVVASPVGEKKHVIRHGINGFLAGTEEDWYQYLRYLSKMCV
jgi:glycosyltransferase involved in cell wall biosynthesis